MKNKEHKIKIKETERITYKDIIKDDNIILRKVSKEIEYPLTKENRRIMIKMIDYVRRSQDENDPEKSDLRPAYGISAVQIGFLKKMFYIRIVDEMKDSIEEFALINPEIISSQGEKAFLENGEGCLSVETEHKGYVYRNNKVVIRAIDYFTDREVEITAKGLASIVIQHEYDHLLGVLFYDRINKLNPYFNVKNSIKIK